MKNFQILHLVSIENNAHAIHLMLSEDHHERSQS